MGLINWCDEKITELKNNNISFVRGRPIVPEHMRYDDIPGYIETYQFRNEIPIEYRKKSLICFYSMEDRLWNRLKTLDSDCIIFSKFAGIVGMDFSPSVNMLKPRQLQSILINNIYDCLISLRGIKVAINSRIGDLSTNFIISDYPNNKTIIFGNIGCKRKFGAYSLLQFNKWIEKAQPKNICLYGSISKNDIVKISKLNKNITINFFHGHNFAKKNNKKSVFVICGNKHTRNTPREGYVLKYILSHDIKKSNSRTNYKVKGGENCGR